MISSPVNYDPNQERKLWQQKHYAILKPQKVLTGLR